MKSIDKITFNKALKWYRSIFNQIKVISDHSKEHGRHESSTFRLKTNKGRKIFSYTTCSFIEITTIGNNWQTK